MTHHAWFIQGFVHAREAFYQSSTSLAPKSIIVACDASLKHLGSLLETQLRGCRTTRPSAISWDSAVGPKELT